MAQSSVRVKKQVIFHIITFASIFSIFFSEFNVEAFNAKYLQDFTQVIWQLISCINPAILYIILTIWLYKSQKLENIGSLWLDGNKLGVSYKNSAMYIIFFLLLIATLILSFDEAKIVLEKLSNANILTRVFYGGIYEEYIFRFCLSNILFSMARFKQNHVKVNITQAVLFAFLHYNYSLLASNPGVFMVAFSFNFVFAYTTYLIARKNGLEFSMLFHAIVHVFIYSISSYII